MKVKKINWECADCGNSFEWWISRPAETEEEKQHLIDYGYDSDEDYNDNPRNEQEWEEAELYDVTEPYEPELVSERILEDNTYCSKCKKKIKELELE